MLPPDSSLHRFIAFMRGEAEGTGFQRFRYYAFRLVVGGIVGFMVIAMATPSRDRSGEGFSIEVYLGAIVAGAVVLLAASIVPRLLHPQDWPTREEFRQGAARKKDESGDSGSAA